VVAVWQAVQVIRRLSSEQVPSLDVELERGFERGTGLVVLLLGQVAEHVPVRHADAFSGVGQRDGTVVNCGEKWRLEKGFAVFVSRW